MTAIQLSSFFISRQKRFLHTFRDSIKKIVIVPRKRPIAISFPSADWKPRKQIQLSPT